MTVTLTYRGKLSRDEAIPFFRQVIRDHDGLRGRAAVIGLQPCGDGFTAIAMTWSRTHDLEWRVL